MLHELLESKGDGIIWSTTPSGEKGFYVSDALALAVRWADYRQVSLRPGEDGNSMLSLLGYYVRTHRLRVVKQKIAQRSRNVYIFVHSYEKQQLPVPLSSREGSTDSSSGS